MQPVSRRRVSDAFGIDCMLMCRDSTKREVSMFFFVPEIVCVTSARAPRQTNKKKQINYICVELVWISTDSQSIQANPTMGCMLLM